MCISPSTGGLCRGQPLGWYPSVGCLLLLLPLKYCYCCRTTRNRDAGELSILAVFVSAISASSESTQLPAGKRSMGRPLVYCAICGGPFMNIYNNIDFHNEYKKRALSESETEVGFHLFSSSTNFCFDIIALVWEHFRAIGNCNFS